MDLDPPGNSCATYLDPWYVVIVGITGDNDEDLTDHDDILVIEVVGTDWRQLKLDLAKDPTINFHIEVAIMISRDNTVIEALDSRMTLTIPALTPCNEGFTVTLTPDPIADYNLIIGVVQTIEMAVTGQSHCSYSIDSLTTPDQGPLYL